MKILFLCTAFNSLSQRIALVLKARGHAVTIELALSPALMISAAEMSSPDIIICPFLTKRVPPEIYNRWLTLIVHPGPPGDAGPSALDWVLVGDMGQCGEAELELSMINSAHASANMSRRIRSHWGVTVLQAIEALDAGPVWGFDQFELDEHTRIMSKSDLYRGPVTRAAVNAVLSAVELIHIVAAQKKLHPTYAVDLPAPEFARTHCVSRGRPFLGGPTHDRPLLKASSRDFLQLKSHDGWLLRAEAIVQRIACGDSQPGVLTNLFGTPMFVYNAVVQSGVLPGYLAARQNARIGTVLATRDGAVLVEVGADCPIWISHLRRPKSKAEKYLPPKLPATMALMSVPECASRLGLQNVLEWSLSQRMIEAGTPWQKIPGTFQQVWVELEPFGNGECCIGYVHSEFYNGAFSTAQCEMLLGAISWTLLQPGLKALVMLGGSGYFSNGIALNVIEGSEDPSAEGWANINAIDDCIQALLAPAGIVTFAAIRGNVAAGGLAFATAADVVLCAESAVLNPHYRGVGLYGSEWHTFSWYERCGANVAKRFARDMLPMSSTEACKIGLIDQIIDNNKMNASQLLIEVKSIVRNIMTAKVGDIPSHVGAPWTRPLRRVETQDVSSLSQHMLQNKIKFLAYTFAGIGLEGLSFDEHFRRYREQELGQMALDFFHPHRSKRFASRCTAFVRKLVPKDTPLRFALHRRYQDSGNGWDKKDHDVVLKNIEELDEFDGLGNCPSSAAVTRWPRSRPEYIQEVQDITTGGVVETSIDHVSSPTPSLCSSSSRSVSWASCSNASTPAVSPSESPCSNTGNSKQETAEKPEICADMTIESTYHSPALFPLDHSTKFELDVASMISPPNDRRGRLQDKFQTMWSCYYSEDGQKHHGDNSIQQTTSLVGDTR